MIFAAFRTLTWGTVAAAVLSALLLAASGGSMPRIGGLTVQAVGAGGPSRPGPAGSQTSPNHDAQAAAITGPLSPSH